MRGTLLRFCSLTPLVRFIPAYAGNTCAGSWPSCRTSVHPRVCGEHASNRRQITSPTGSSPRMRGTRVLQHLGAVQVRFIPAYAGNTPPAKSARAAAAVHPRVCGEHTKQREKVSVPGGSSPRMRGTPPVPSRRRTGAAVHPRVCGEHQSFIALDRNSAGSSPRMRGTLKLANLLCKPRRFIPAYAGNTAQADDGVLLVPGSSPRMRGTQRQVAHDLVVERFIPAYAGNTPKRNGIDAPCAGSSPRMRGTQHLPTLILVGDRFIPAYAGNTGMDSGRADPLAVHPRVCGEHVAAGVVLPPAHGSSPRMRGTPSAASRFRRDRRFIPAYAGNTDDQNPFHPIRPVHPRVCGEHAKLAADRLANKRFIPAYAGNTAIPCVRICAMSVHPRVCGEHTLGPNSKPCLRGSSPRMRGTLLAGLHLRGGRRFIPAYAGNTICSTG